MKLDELESYCDRKIVKLESDIVLCENKHPGVEDIKELMEWREELLYINHLRRCVRKLDRILELGRGLWEQLMAREI